MNKCIFIYLKHNITQEVILKSVPQEKINIHNTVSRHHLKTVHYYEFLSQGL